PGRRRAGRSDRRARAGGVRRGRRHLAPAVCGRGFVKLDAVISGAGQWPVARRLMREPLGLTVDAVLAALADAGLTTADVDGIATYPGGIDQPPGFAGGIGVAEVQDALRLDLDWYAGGIESPGQLGAIVQAAL